MSNDNTCGVSSRRNADDNNEASSSSFVSSHPWSRIRKRSATEALELAQQTSTRTSEYRLRMESVQWWQRQLETAQTKAWQRLVAPTLEECFQFLQGNDKCSYSSVGGTTTQEEEEETTTSTTTTADANEGPNDDATNQWWQQFCLPSTTTTATSLSSGSSSLSRQSPRIQYPPEILPIMILHSALSTGCLLDQQYLATTLWKQWKRPNDLCLYLPRLLPTLTDTMHLLADALATAIQESSHYCKYAYLVSGRKKRKQTLQSSMQEWIFDVLQSLPAEQNQTTANLVIILQDDIAGSAIVKRQFLQTMMAWRSLHGIPVSLVVLASSKSAENSLSTMIKRGEHGATGRFGLRETRLYVPSPVVDANEVSNVSTSSSAADALSEWTQYFVEALQETPAPLRPSNEISLPLYHWMQESLMESASCTRIVDHLRQLVTEFFSQPGSFVWDSLRCTPPTQEDLSPNVNTFQPTFCAWFCVYEKAQRMLSMKDNDDDDDATKTMLSTSDKCQALLQCRHLLHSGGKLHFWWNLSCALLPIQVWTVVIEQNLAITADHVHALRRNSRFILSCLCRAQGLLARHGAPKSTTTTDEDDEVDKILTRYLCRGAPLDGESSGRYCNEQEMRELDSEPMAEANQMIGEMIILVDRATSLNQNDSALGIDTSNRDIWKGLVQMMLEINRLAASQLDYFTRWWMHKNPLMKYMDVQDPQLSNRDFSLVPSPRFMNIRRNIVSGLSPTVQRLLNVLQDQMVISQEDWFHTWDGTMEEFSIGVWMLQMMGIIQIKKGGGSHKTMYEKVSVVWC
jgi:hypothetical protein